VGSSTRASRAASFARALENLRISGIVLKHDPRFEALKDAYIDGSLTVEEIIQELGAFYMTPTSPGDA
jgi:hypothetical protein